MEVNVNGLDSSSVYGQATRRIIILMAPCLARDIFASDYSVLEPSLLSLLGSQLVRGMQPCMSY